MSAEIRPFSPSEASSTKEADKFVSPFPLEYDIINQPFDNPDEYKSIEIPMQEALSNMLILRCDANQVIDSAAYIHGVAFTRLAINRQMAADNLPQLNNEQLEFTNHIYTLEWSTKLQSAPKTPDLNTSSHINTERIKRAQMVYDNSIPRFNTDLRAIKSIFNKEDQRQIQHLIEEEPEFNQFTIDYLDQRLNLKTEAYSFHTGITDTYFFYNTYFEALNWKNSD